MSFDLLAHQSYDVSKSALVYNLPNGSPSHDLPTCYPVYQLFSRAVESSPEKRAEIIEQVERALEENGFNPKGNFLPIHDAEGDDFVSQPLRALSDTKTSIVIIQAGQYLSKHEPSEEQRDQTTVTNISKTVHATWVNNLKRLGLDNVNIVRGFEIGRPDRGVFAEDITPFEITAEDEENLEHVVNYLTSQQDKSVEILLNAPGYTLAKLIETQPELLKQKVKTVYMSGFASINSTDGMTSIIKLVELTQTPDANISIIIRDGNYFRAAEDLNFLFIQALKKLATELDSEFASSQLDIINEWKEFDASSRQVRAGQGKDVSQATKDREERLKIVKANVEQASGAQISDEEQTVLSDLFMWVIAYTNKDQLVTEDFDNITIKKEYKPRSRERSVDFHPSNIENTAIFKRVKDIKFKESNLTFEDINITLDKNSYLALTILFTLLKKVQEEKTY